MHLHTLTVLGLCGGNSVSGVLETIYSCPGTRRNCVRRGVVTVTARSADHGEAGGYNCRLVMGM